MLLKVHVHVIKGVYRNNVFFFFVRSDTKIKVKT